MYFNNLKILFTVSERIFKIHFGINILILIYHRFSVFSNTIYALDTYYTCNTFEYNLLK